jgi:HEAT repeat protein
MGCWPFLEDLRRYEMWPVFVILASFSIGVSLTAKPKVVVGNYLPLSTESATSFGACDVESAIRDFSLGRLSTVRPRLTQLKDESKTSPACRTKVISALMFAMDKPDLDFTRDRSSYFLWLYGSHLLGDLQATEALDLLISHLDLDDGFFSTSMNHQPALDGVIKMGTAAIPKLDYVLKRDPKATKRHAAVYCIATIGGREASKALKEALSTESDQCVRRFLQISLESFDDESRIKDRAAWFSGYFCN